MARELPRLRLPRPVAKGQPVRASDYNLLLAAFRQLEGAVLARTPQPSADIGHRYTTGGFTAFLKRKGRGGGGGAQPLSASIVPIPDTDPVEYGVRVSPGYLLYQNAAATGDLGTTGYLMPRIDGVPLDATADDDPAGPPILPLPGLASYVYLRVKTTEDGVPKEGDGDVVIEAFGSAQQSTHHVRPSPSGGQEEGDYYFLLLQTESNEATPTPAPRVVRRIAGHMQMPNQLIEIRNIGGKRELYSGYQTGPDDTHEVRTLEQVEVPAGVQGAEVLVPLDPGSPATDPVVVEGVVITPGSPAVPPEEEGPTIKIRYLRKGNSGSTPYTISGDGDAMKLQFTGFSGFIDLGNGGQINFDSGLATSGTSPDESGGWWGTRDYLTGGGTLVARTIFQAGRLIAVFNASGGGAPVALPGTEQAPGYQAVTVT